MQEAVLLQTLTEQQINDALRQVGDKADTVRAVLKRLQDTASHYHDSDAEALMRTPLMLSVITLAYQEDTSSELPPFDAAPAVQQ